MLPRTNKKMYLEDYKKSDIVVVLCNKTVIMERIVTKPAFH